MDDATKNAIDEIICNIEDDVLLGQAICMLGMEPKHYEMLAKLMKRPVAMQAYLKTMVKEPQQPDPSTVFEAPMEEEEAMLNECRDRFGTEMRRMETAGILPLATLNGAKKATTGIICAGSYVGAHFAKQGADAIAKAAAATAAAQAAQATAQAAQAAANAAASTATACNAISFVSFCSGNPVESTFWHFMASIYKDSEKASQALAKQASETATASQALATQSEALAISAEQLAVWSKWAGRAGWVLTVGMLGYEFYSEIRKYYKGEIDGHKLAENLTAVTLGTAAGMGGGVAAVTLCAGAGVAGLVFASIAGAILAGMITDASVRACFKGLFGSDRDRAVIEAYNILGLKEDATEQEVRAQYLRLAKECHPDKPKGDHTKFIKVNSAYELIRASVLAD